VFVFEANPFTCRVLDVNIALNGLTDTISAAYTGIGLGSHVDSLNVVYPQVNNLGSARLAASIETQDVSYPVSAVPVLPLDSLNIACSYRVGFVKLDVEGMELDVLRGAERFIASNRPAMFVEVHNEHAVAFNEWAASNGYGIFERFQRYPQCENFLIASTR
jgi:FkbM family methyltransferase